MDPHAAILGLPASSCVTHHTRVPFVKFDRVCIGTGSGNDSKIYRQIVIIGPVVTSFLQHSFVAFE